MTRYLDAHKLLNDLMEVAFESDKNKVLYPLGRGYPAFNDLEQIILTHQLLSNPFLRPPPTEEEKPKEKVSTEEEDKKD